MGSNERRRILRESILSSKTPLSSEALLQKLGVSKQILMQDLAVLRTEGVKLIATPFGYLPDEEGPEPRHTALFACRHTTLELSRTELLIIVQCGGIVRSVLIDHPLYGEMSVSMMIRT